MRSDHARFIMGNLGDIVIVVVVGEVSGCGLRRRRTVAGRVLAEIGNRKFGFARMVFQEILQFGRVMHMWDLRKRNLGLIWRGCHRGLRGDTRRRGAKDENPKETIPDDGPHLGYLYITYNRPPATVIVVPCRIVRAGFSI